MFAPISFFVAGIPASAGSKRPIRRHGKTILVDTCQRNRSWRQAIQVAAARAYPHELINCPVRLRLEFTFRRPGCHYLKRKSGLFLRPDAPLYPDVAPDLTKLVRAAEDALNGWLWRDDCRVVAQAASKDYGQKAGALFVIEPADLLRICHVSPPGPEATPATP